MGITSWNADGVVRAAEAAARRKLSAAGAFLSGRLKEVLSVPAPRRRARSGRVYAATAATPGAPPRKLTGRLRTSVAYQVVGNSVRVGSNVIYAGVHEKGNHPWLVKTVIANQAAAVSVMESTA